MPFARRQVVQRRLTVLLLWLLAVVLVEVALPASNLAPGTATAVADSGAAYDRSLTVGDCALLGRAYDSSLGCARNACLTD
ncbi:MAG: hypothetical protein QOF53_328, partial [Nocardioidaceae bacterium]|nr:hypothetical protein [Nocardioidaceae bacterium]